MEPKKPPSIDPRYIIEIQGQQFVKHEGLLALFHERGGKSITTELLPYNEALGMFIFKAMVVCDAGTFVGHGDACAANVNKMIAPHILRMSETRAVNRALRFALNIGLCSIDELGGDGELPKATVKKQAYSNNPPIDIIPEQNLKPCHKCGTGRFVLKEGKFGPFYSCNNYPKCKSILKIEDAEMWVESPPLDKMEF